MDFILGKAEKEQKEFKQIAIELAKSHSLCAATEEGRGMKHKNLAVKCL